jgi:hypothetical protein
MFILRRGAATVRGGLGRTAALQASDLFFCATVNADACNLTLRAPALIVAHRPRSHSIRLTENRCLYI